MPSSLAFPKYNKGTAIMSFNTKLQYLKYWLPSESRQSTKLHYHCPSTGCACVWLCACIWRRMMNAIFQVHLLMTKRENTGIMSFQWKWLYTGKLWQFEWHVQGWRYISTSFLGFTVSMPETRWKILKKNIKFCWQWHVSRTVLQNWTPLLKAETFFSKSK